MVMELYGRAILNYASTRLVCCGITTVNPGDASKTWSQVARVCEQAERARLPRHGVIAGVGGGVTLDISGLAASLYHRGVGYVRVPTTLMGMVDVAVGIKHAINFNGKKSLLGAFYPPLGVVNDFGFLKTLPRTELANGFSEIIKLGMVRDRILFEWLEQYGERLLRSGFQEPLAWARRIALRSEYVMMADLQPNLYESEFRRFPDFGHTFSAGIEEASDYLLPHGQAVAIDMLLATIIAVRRGLCTGDVLSRLTALYRGLGLLALPSICTGEVLAGALTSTRLHRGGQIHMVLPAGLGEGRFVEDVDAEEACCALDRAVEICAAAKSTYYAGTSR
jgi:3-dehydroquinate synthase